MILLLKLHVPLQSYGSGSRHSIRRSDRLPTKSAIIGMFCAGLGINDRTEPQSTIKLADLNSLQMAVRLDKSGSYITDYHTIQNVMIVDGGPSKETEVTRRQYIEDACFLVALQGEAAVLQAVVAALENPKWFLYLGRKSCPAPPDMVQGLFERDGLLEFLSQYPYQLDDECPIKLEVVIESNKGQLARDVLIAFGEPKRYGCRRIEHHMISL